MEQPQPNLYSPHLTSPYPPLPAVSKGSRVSRVSRWQAGKQGLAEGLEGLEQGLRERGEEGRGGREGAGGKAVARRQEARPIANYGSLSRSVAACRSLHRFALVSLVAPRHALPSGLR